MLGKIGPDFLGNEKFFVRQTHGLSIGVHELHACFAVGLIRSGNLWDTFPDQSMSHDKLGPAGLSRFGLLEGGQKLLHVIAVDLVNVKSVSLKAERSVLALAQ